MCFGTSLNTQNIIDNIDIEIKEVAWSVYSGDVLKNSTVHTSITALNVDVNIFWIRFCDCFLGSVKKKETLKPPWLKQPLDL